MKPVTAAEIVLDASALVRGLHREAEQAAATMLEAATASEITRYSSVQFARPAFELAVDTGLSAYDAFYAVLAEALDLPLVTADRKLAAAIEGSVLVT